MLKTDPLKPVKLPGLSVLIGDPKVGKELDEGAEKPKFDGWGFGGKLCDCEPNRVPF